MHPLLSSVFDVWAGKEWLIAANLVLSALVAFWTVRYRRLYLRTLAEQENNADLVENLSEGIYRALPDGRHRRLAGQHHAVEAAALAPILIDFFAG